MGGGWFRLASCSDFNTAGKYLDMAVRVRVINVPSRWYVKSNEPLPNVALPEFSVLRHASRANCRSLGVLNVCADFEGDVGDAPWPSPVERRFLSAGASSSSVDASELPLSGCRDEEPVSTFRLPVRSAPVGVGDGITCISGFLPGVASRFPVYGSKHAVGAARGAPVKGSYLLAVGLSVRTNNCRSALSSNRRRKSSRRLISSQRLFISNTSVFDWGQLL